MTYSVDQVRQKYGVGPHTVLQWIRSGELHAVNVGRSPGGKPHWRITSEALQAFELLRSAQPSDPQPRCRRRRNPQVIEFY
jgi:excisionase family DNA binding protein